MSKVVHIEIPSTDFDKSKTFYEKVFGWKVELIPDMNYAMWSPTDNKEDIGGGFTKVDKPCECAEGCNTVYLGVDCIDTKVKEIEAAGGTVAVPKTAISDFGFFAVFKDTAGGSVALYEAVPKK